MPLLRVKEIRDMKSDQRLDKIDEFKTEVLRLKTMVRAGGTVENPARIKELHRAIARVLTVEKEEKLGIKVIKERPKEKTKEKKTAKTKPKSDRKKEEEAEKPKKEPKPKE